MAAGFVGFGVGKFIPEEDALNVGKKFTKWIRNLERSMRLSGITAAARKIDALYQEGGDHLEDIANNLDNLPARAAQDGGPRDAYEEIRDKLLAYWTPRRNVSHATMKFMNLVQKPGEPTSTYIVRLREASEDCDFGDADAVNRRIREQVLLSGNNTKLKRKAMESDWNLTQIINHAKLMEDSSRQMEDMSMRRLNGNIESSIPVVVKQEEESKKTRTRRYSHLKPDRRDTYVVKPKLDQDARKPKCGRCGFVHQQGRCPAFGKNCNKCGKKNHFSAVCHSENKKFSEQMTRHRKRDRTNKNTMEICEDRSDESDSYGDDGSDSEVEYGLVSHKIDLLSLFRQSFKTELSEAEHYEIFEYDAEDEYEEPYHDMVSFRDSENDQSFTFGDRSVLGDILEAPVPPPMQFRYEALEMSIPPLPDLCCSETEESDLDCNDEPYEPQNEDLVI